ARAGTRRRPEAPDSGALPAQLYPAPGAGTDASDRRLIFAANPTLLSSMRNLILAAAAALVLSATGVSADYSKDELADLDRLSAALNDIHTLKGEFTQIDPNGAIESG